MPLRPGEPKLSFALTGVAALLVLSGLLPGISSTAEGAVPDVASACGPIVQDDRIGRYCETDDGMLKTFSTRTGRFLGYVHAEDHPRELFLDPFGDPRGEEETGDDGPREPDTLAAPALEDGGRYVAGARQPHCVGPDTPDPAYHTRVLYVRYLTGENTYPEKEELIRQLVREANGLLYDTGKQLGRTLHYKVHCNTEGEITVDNVVLPSVCEQSDCFNDIVDQTRQQYNDHRVKYWIWTENSSCQCAGKAHRYNDDTAGVANDNNGNMGVPMFAVTFNGAASVRLMMHEHGHMMGAVQEHTTTDHGHNNRGHCWDGKDIMCLVDVGQERPYDEDVCADIAWDCNHDTYFHPNPAPDSYLAGHWNLASPANRYLIAGNSYPDAAFDSLAVEEDSPSTWIPVLANDADPDGDALFLQSVTTPVEVHMDAGGGFHDHGDGSLHVLGPSGATASVNGEGVDYRPPPDYFGTDVFNYVVRDRADPADKVVLNATGLVRVAVTPVNDAPVAEEDRFVLEEDGTLGIALQAFDADGDGLTWTVVDPPESGALEGVAPDLVYTPDPDFYGECQEQPTWKQPCDSFNFTVSDGALEGQATVWLDVLPVDDLPVVQDDADYTNVDAQQHVLVLANDAAGPGREATDEALHLAALGPTSDEADLVPVPAVASTQEGGTVQLATIGGVQQVQYDPPAGYLGDDSFGYRACDDGPDTLCAVGTVTIHVVDGDVAAFPDSYTTDEDARFEVDLMDGVLFRSPDPDVFPDNDGALAGLANVTVEPVSGVSNGALALRADGSFAYEPDADFHGTDSFRYLIIHDNGTGAPFESNIVTVTIVVASVDDAPQAQDQALVMAEDSSVSIELVATDAEDTYEASPAVPLTFTIKKPPGQGRLEGSPPDLVYVPRGEFSGQDVFTFRATDSDGLSAEANVTLEVVGRNDAPLASDDAYRMRPDQTNRVFPGDGVLFNDRDADGDPLHAQAVHAPQHGVLELHGDGGFLYTPDPGYTGQDLFTYRVTDTHGAASYMATVVLDVQANQPPVADMHTAFTTVPMGQPIQFLDRSSDPDGTIEAWSWDFADGVQSGQRDPRHTFPRPGEYRVSLTVTDDEHATSTKSLRMLVTQPDVAPQAAGMPTADAGESPLDVLAGSSVTLVGNATATQTMAYQWRQTGGQLVDLHGAHRRNATFQAPVLDEGERVRVLTFALTVFDGRQESAPSTVQVHVFAPYLAPVVSVDAGPDIVTLSGATVHRVPTYDGFSDRPTLTWRQVEGPPVEFRTGDGALQFVAPHTQDVTSLTFAVQGAADGLSSAPDEVTVAVQPATAPRGFDVTPMDDASFRFVARLDANASQDLDYTWDFGDGTEATGLRPRHVYTQEGTYTVRLTASNGLGYTQSWTEQVDVDDVPRRGHVDGTADAAAGGRSLPLLTMALAGGATLVALAGAKWFQMRRRPQE